MKKNYYFAALGLLVASCASDEIVDTATGYKPATDAPISFVTSQKNITRAYSPLQDNHTYNFGVFAYKSTDKVNPVMPNYLVGYYDDAKAYQQTGTTVGDKEELVDGLSYWMYEGMGNAEYNGTYAGAAITNAFKSNNANQYLKYWDKAADYTYFYAYAPYINSSVKPTATYVDGTAQSATGTDTYVLTIPNGTLTDGYDDPSLAEYMYASAKVAKANYGHDVALQFKRLNAKVNIKFWEDIPGYKVRILDLNNTYGVSAAASIKEAGKGDFGYKGGKYYTANGVKIKFNDGAFQSMKQFEGTLAEPAAVDGNNPTPLNFKSPTEAQIGENRYTAVQSPTTYYAIPKGDGVNVLADGNTDFTTDQACDADLAKTGFTFHVSYELTAEDTGEKIVVKNATVHVPYTYANWKGNTHYTYIFKITKNSNGSTDPDDDSNIDPTDPEVPTTPALYPIIFDNCTVVDWDELDGEWNISDGNATIYHDVQLFAEAGCTTPKYSLVSGDIYVKVTDEDTYANHTIDYTKITLAGPDLTNVTYDNATHKITVATGAGAGVYTVTYTCPATGDQTTHPATWTEKFVVGNEYAITTHRDVIGTKSNNASAKLNITGTKDGTATALTSANLSIDYPDNFSDEDKAHVAISGTDVVVKSTAKPGVYKVVYTIDEGSVVKVAEKQFTVVDYSLTLSHTVVFNTASGTVVTGNQAADANHVYTCTTGSVSGNAITVANNTAEGTYTVTYTVYGSEDDETVYTKTFEVRNTHAVAVSKAAIDRNVGTSNTGDLTTDNIVVSTTFNGVATTADLTAKLSIVKLAADGTETATTAGDFSIVYDSANNYNLKVKNNVATGDYYVKFVQTVAGADKAEYVHFVVTE